MFLSSKSSNHFKIWINNYVCPTDLPLIGSDNWNASGCKGLSPMMTIQPTTDVILLGSVLNWSKQEKHKLCIPLKLKQVKKIITYIVYETFWLLNKLIFFFKSIYISRETDKIITRYVILYLIYLSGEYNWVLLKLCHFHVRLYMGNTTRKFPIVTPNTLSMHQPARRI